MRIKTFETSLTGNSKFHEIEERAFEIPKARRRNTGRKYENKNRISHGPWWQEVFEQNEKLAYERKAKDNEELKRMFLLEFNDLSLRRRFKTYRQTIGMYRKEYNQQKLYQAQPPNYLVSFQYDASSLIVVGGNFPTTYMSFQDCYQRCVNLKVADPRFVPPEYIVAIRDRQNEGIEMEWLDWIVPDEKEVKRLQRYLDVPELYNSVHFPQGWTREETPIGYECPFE